MRDSADDPRYHAPYDPIRTEAIDSSTLHTTTSSPPASFEPHGSPHSNCSQGDMKIGPSVFPALDASSVHSPSTSFHKPINIYTKRQEPGHIPRPRNAFIIFRSEYIQRHRDIGEDQQNELSKRAGRAWNAMSEEEKEWFREEAKKERDQHKEMYPGYAYVRGSKTNANVRARNGKLKSPSPRRACLFRGVHEDSPSPSPSSASSPPSSPEFVASLANSSCTTRRIAAPQRAEKISSVPSQEMRRSSPIIFIPELIHSTNFTTEYSNAANNFDRFLLSNEIPALALDCSLVTTPGPQLIPSQDGCLSMEPSFTLDTPPTLGYDSEHHNFGWDAYLGLVPERFPEGPSILPLSNTPAIGSTFDMDGWGACLTPELGLDDTYGAIFDSGLEVTATGSAVCQSYPMYADEAYDVDFWIQSELLVSGGVNSL